MTGPGRGAPAPDKEQSMWIFVTYEDSDEMTPSWITGTFGPYPTRDAARDAAIAYGEPYDTFELRK